MALEVLCFQTSSTSHGPIDSVPQDQCTLALTALLSNRCSFYGARHWHWQQTIFSPLSSLSSLCSGEDGRLASALSQTCIALAVVLPACEAVALSPILRQLHRHCSSDMSTPGCESAALKHSELSAEMLLIMQCATALHSVSRLGGM